ncbi:MAG: ABC transporter substrate-binding protein [Bradymonadia bacterium]|jgi:hypothetical protein
MKKRYFSLSVALILLFLPACGGLATRPAHRQSQAQSATTVLGAQAAKDSALPQRSVKYIDVAQSPQANPVLQEALEQTQDPQEQRQIIFLIKRNELQSPETRDAACDYLASQSPSQYDDPNLVTAHALYSLSCATQSDATSVRIVELPQESIQSLSQETVQTLQNPWIAPQDESLAWKTLAHASLEAKKDDEALYYYGRAYEHEATASIKAQSFAVAARLLASPERAALVLDGHIPVLTRAALGYSLLSRCLHKPDSSCPIDALEDVKNALNAVDESTKAELLKTSNALTAKSEPIVAAVLPLSGASLRMGRAMLGAMLMAQGVFDRRSTSFHLLFLDSESSPDGTVRAMEQAKALGAAVVIGSLNTNETKAAARAAQELSLPLIAFSVDDSFVNPYAMQFSSSIQAEAAVVAQNLSALEVKRILPLFPVSNYAQTANEALRLAAANFAIQVLNPIHFDQAQADLSTLAKQIVKSQADAIFLPVLPAIAERLLSFLNQENTWCMGKKPSSYKGDTRKFIRCISLSSWSPLPENHNYRALQNSLYLDYAEAPRANNIDSIDFSEGFATLYKRKPALYEVLAYSAVRMLNSLDENAWHSPENLQSELSKKSFINGRYHLKPSLFLVEQAKSSLFKP